MGSSQSTSSSRAAKFSGNGNRRSVRATRSAPATDVAARRATSVRNTNRNVKEFSKFWSDAGQVNRSKSSTRQSVKKGANTNGSVRRSRTQSVDVRRTSSNCLPVPGNVPTPRSPQQTQKRASSFRGSATLLAGNGTATSSTLSVNSERRRSKTSDNTPNNNGLRSEIYSAEFNQAAIAAARLKRLSLTPYPVDQLSPHQHFQQQQQQRHSYQQSPETAIY